MITDLSSMRKRARKPTGVGGPLGTDQDVVDDNAVDEHLNFSYRALLDTYAFREKEIVASVSTEIGRRNYPMPNPHDGLRQIDILHPTSYQHTKLLPMSVARYTDEWNEDDGQLGYPTHYVRENCLYRLWPTPDKVYTLTLRYWGILQDLSTDDQTIEIPNVWLEPIILGATVRIFMFDLGDVQRAEVYQKFQAKLISDIAPIQTKEEEDYHSAGLEVLGREY